MRQNSSKSSGDNHRDDKKPFNRKDNNKPFNKSARPDRKAASSGEGDRERKPFDRKRSDNEGRPSGDRPKRNFDKPSFKKEDGDKQRKSFDRKPGGDKPFNDRPKRSFDKPSFKREDGEQGGEKPRKSFDRKPGGDRPFNDRPKRSFDKPSFKREDGEQGGERPRKSFDRKPGGDKPFNDRPKRSFDKPSFKREGGEQDGERPRKSFDRKPGGHDKPFGDKPKRSFDKPGFRKNDAEGDKKSFDKKPKDSRPFRERLDKAFDKPPRQDRPDDIRLTEEDGVKSELEDVKPFKPFKPFKVKERAKKEVKESAAEKKEKATSRRKKHFDEDEDDEDGEDSANTEESMPVNKYIAHSGECSRRDAAELVRQGKVKVNDEMVLDPGHKINPGDKVTLSGKKLTPQKGFVYILLNKPKGFITTNEDPQGRKTVMELVASSGVDRLFAVGRLDRNTSGLLLITNDGDLTQKLSHPAYNIKKVYHVTLDKPLTKADFDKIIEGVELEDGKAIVDALAFLEKKNELGLEIHSGRNRIVRRIFESLGYVVDKLDRVMYAGLTKKNLPRSKWRYLDQREIVLLKHFKN